MKLDLRRAWKFFWRACLLKCPECGTKHLFLSVLRVRRLADYFAPLDGCPRCGYAYERETGYFLLAIWAINYGFGSLLGIGMYFYLEYNYRIPLEVLIPSVVLPVVFFNVFFARHSKAFFLALDHYFDPHQKEEPGNGGGWGNVRTPAGPVEPPAPTKAPEPAEPTLVS